MFRARPLRFVLPLGKDYSGTSTKSNVQNSTSEAFKAADKMVTVIPQLLCNMGCETPRINYSSHLGKPYRYFYAISSDVDLDNPGTVSNVITLVPIVLKSPPFKSKLVYYYSEDP